MFLKIQPRNAYIIWFFKKKDIVTFIIQGDINPPLNRATSYFYSVVTTIKTQIKVHFPFSSTQS